MFAMTMLVFLIIFLSSGLDAVTSQPNDQPQYLMEFEAAIDQKLTKMERQLTDKDVRIRNLETKLEDHIAAQVKYVQDNDRAMQMKNSEVDQLRQHVASLIETVTSLTQKLSETCTESRELASRMSVLEQAIVANCVNANCHRGSSDKPVLSNATYAGPVPMPSTVPTAGPVTMAGPVDKAGPIREDGPFSNSESLKVTSEDGVVLTQRTRAVPYSSIVAFHSELTHSAIFRTGSIIVFNHETLDEGYSYNPGDGIFIVPEDGTYVMTWKTIAEFRTHVQTYLNVNGAKRGSSFSDSQEVHDLHQATGLVVLNLNQGDHVFIQVGHTSHTNATLHSDTNYSGRPTFSGWKLF